MRMRLLVAVWFVGILGICSPGWSTEPRFRLTVLKQGWHELGLTYAWEEAWPRLQKAASGKPLFTIDERDVVSYDWEAQRIVPPPRDQPQAEGAQDDW